jgi:hypothetical protein
MVCYSKWVSIQSIVLNDISQQHGDETLKISYVYVKDCESER